MLGKVLAFNDLLGFGFIETSSKKKVFVHYSEIQTNDTFKTLKPGQVVEFEMYESTKGYKAKSVILRND